MMYIGEYICSGIMRLINCDILTNIAINKLYYYETFKTRYLAFLGTYRIHVDPYLLRTKDTSVN